MCVSFVQILQALHPAILGAVNRIHIYFRFSTASFGVNLSAFIIGLHWGLIGVAFCFAVASLLLATVSTALVSRALLVSPLSVLTSLRGLWQPAAAMAGAAVSVRQAALSEGLGPWVNSPRRGSGLNRLRRCRGLVGG